MQLVCPICGYAWSDEPAANQAVLLCPKCMEFSPVAEFRAGPPPGAGSGGDPMGGGRSGHPGQPGGPVVGPGRAGSAEAPVQAGPSAQVGHPASPGRPAHMGRDAPPGASIQPGRAGRFSGQESIEATVPLSHPGSAPAPADPLAPSGHTRMLHPTAPREAGPPDSSDESFSEVVIDESYAPPTSAGFLTLPVASPQAPPGLPHSHEPRPFPPAPVQGRGPVPQGAASAHGVSPQPGPGAPPPAHRPPGAPSRQQTPVAPGASSSKKTGGPKFPELEGLVGKSVGGYRIEGLLGEGGMGAVFLARQLSLDRKVALKVLPGRFSNNPDLLARFTREALSAAQLSHHNIVHVYDVGNERETYYISMEYVKGNTLGDMVRRDGRLRVDDAAGYVLQAARGLHHAHERGIVHRDIKPDNLMVNEYGIVKVADLGLAKMRGSVEMTLGFAGDEQRLLQQEGIADLTQDKASMGTPAYMSPEQARDAAHVDARADQYSLGCTLYYLCAGRAPYSGTTIFELISKHMSEPLTPLDAHVHGVPPAFSRIVQQMLEKDPTDRYSDLKAVIRDLEDYLGIGAEEGAYRPRESHLAILETQEKAFYAAPVLRRRAFALTAWLALLPIVLLAAVVTRDFSLAGAAFGFWCLAPVINFLYDGIRNKSYLFRRVRSAVLGMSLKNWAKAFGGTVVGVGVLYLLGWLPYWIGCALLAVGAAVGHQLLVVRPLAKQRADPLWKMQEMLKELRVRGVSEEAIREFVARFSGESWEEFFEDLFGYEDMIDARGSVAGMEKVKRRKKFATWRDPIAHWLDGIEESRKQARERRQLARVEAKRLKARGLSDAEAAEQAEVEATRILNEVLVQPVPESKVKAAKARHARKLRVATILRMFAIGRAIVGLCIIAGFAAVYAGHAGITLPAAVSGLLGRYWAWGQGDTYLGLAAGGAVFLSAFSGRAFFAVLTVLGAILMVLLHPIVRMVAQPQFTNRVGFLAAAALLVVGFGIPLLKKFSGGRF